jgi:hypothetical protein
LPPLKVSQEIAEKFTESFMDIQIIRCDRLTAEETVDETIKIDISQLLFPKKANEPV